jgi:uncharacterized membrane protein
MKSTQNPPIVGWFTGSTLPRNLMTPLPGVSSTRHVRVNGTEAETSFVASGIAARAKLARGSCVSSIAITTDVGEMDVRSGMSVSHAMVIELAPEAAVPEKQASIVAAVIVMVSESVPYSKIESGVSLLVAKQALRAKVGADVGATVGTAVVGAVVGTVVGAKVGTAVGADVQRLIVEANGAEVKFPSAIPSCIWLPVATHAVKVMSVADHV